MAMRAESKRSSIPPCPGSIVPLSFIPSVRLKSDSTRSPHVPNTTTTNAKPNHWRMLSPEVLVPCISLYPIKAAMARTSIPPPILPSQLLAGDMRGNSLCLPKSEPLQ